MSENVSTLIRLIAKDWRTKQNSSPQAIWKRVYAQARFATCGEFVVTNSILEGCLSVGKVSRKEYANLVRLLPPRSETDCRMAISRKFRKLIG